MFLNRSWNYHSNFLNSGHICICSLCGDSDTPLLTLCGDSDTPQRFLLLPRHPHGFHRTALPPPASPGGPRPSYFPDRRTHDGLPPRTAGLRAASHDRPVRKHQDTPPAAFRSASNPCLSPRGPYGTADDDVVPVKEMQKSFVRHYDNEEWKRSSHPAFDQMVQIYVLLFDDAGWWSPHGARSDSVL